ncbi:MAG: hypothetical protein ABJG47_05370 [Ekhidna sp.]
MTKLLPFILVFLLATSCTEPPELVGLWKLDHISIDMIPRDSSPVFIKFEKSGSFSVSRANGDLIGLYQLNKNDLYFSSTDKKWFDTSWNANIYQGVLVLKGLAYGYRTTELKFVRADQLPSFDEFIEALSGRWELYKIEEKGKEQEINNMQFDISDQEYAITRNDSIIEKGSILVDTRHQKINFANEQIIWKARFVWDELRLENKELGIVYRLRKH